MQQSRRLQASRQACQLQQGTCHLQHGTCMQLLRHQAEGQPLLAPGLGRVGGVGVGVAREDKGGGDGLGLKVVAR